MPPVGLKLPSRRCPTTWCQAASAVPLVRTRTPARPDGLNATAGIPTLKASRHNPNPNLASPHARKGGRRKNRELIEKPFAPEQIRQGKDNFGKLLGYDGRLLNPARIYRLQVQ